MATYQTHEVKGTGGRRLQTLLNEIGSQGGSVISVCWLPESANPKDPENPISAKFVVIVQTG